MAMQNKIIETGTSLIIVKNNKIMLKGVFGNIPGVNSKNES